MDLFFYFVYEMKLYINVCIVYVYVYNFIFVDNLIWVCLVSKICKFFNLVFNLNFL